MTLDYLPSRLTAFGDRLYWLNFTAAEVVSAPKDGSQPPQVIWKAAPLPDHVGVRIFELSPTQAGVVVSTRNIVSFAPSVYSDVVYLISSAGEAKELFRVAGAVASLGANAKDAYVLSRRDLYRLPLNGAPAVREAQNAPAGGQLFVPQASANSDRVYIASSNISGDNSVFRLRNAQLETVATLGGVFLSGIHVLDGNVFVIGKDRDGGDRGGIWRVSDTGTVTRLKQGDFGPSVLGLVGGRTLIWHDNTPATFAQAMDVTGQCFVSLGPLTSDQIAYDDAFVYWPEKGQKKIRRLRIDHPTGPVQLPKPRPGETPEAFHQVPLLEGVETLANKDDAWAFCRESATGKVFYVNQLDVGYGLCGRGTPLITRRGKGVSHRVALFEWRDWHNPELGKPSVGAIFFFTSGGGIREYECVSTNRQLDGEKDVNGTRPPNETSPPSVCATGDVFFGESSTTLRFVLPTNEVAHIELSSVIPAN